MPWLRISVSGTVYRATFALELKNIASGICGYHSHGAVEFLESDAVSLINKFLLFRRNMQLSN